MSAECLVWFICAQSDVCYLCVVWSPAFKSNCILTVADKPFGTKLEASVPDNVGVINTSVILRCTADANPPVTVYNIFHNGVLVSNSSTGILNITRALTEHKGSYVCIPYNVYGVGETASLNVTFVGELKFCLLT